VFVRANLLRERGELAIRRNVEIPDVALAAAAQV
jgi:hypothetical protein